jgi:hypothetical protein
MLQLVWYKGQHGEGTKGYAEVWTHPELIRTRALILYVEVRQSRNKCDGRPELLAFRRARRFQDIGCRLDNLASNLRDSRTVYGLERDLQSNLRDSGFLRGGTSRG